MSDSLLRFGPMQPALIATVVGSAPSGGYAVVRDITFCNTTALPVAVTLGINGVSAVNSLYFNYSIPANQTVVRVGNIALLGGATPDSLMASQATVGAVTITATYVSGP